MVSLPRIEACPVPVSMSALGRTARAEPLRTIPRKLDELIRGVHERRPGLMQLEELT